MANTYKHFKKSEEFFLGLSALTCFYSSLLLMSFIWLVLAWKLNPNSPLFIFIAIVYMVIMVFIIKASQDEEIKGFYSSFLTHPFADHIFMPTENEEGYKTIAEIHNIKEITTDYLLSKEGDLIGILELDNLMPWNKTDQINRQRILDDWANFLAQLESINKLDSYLFESSNYGDSLQIFIWIKPYTNHYIEQCLSTDPVIQSLHNFNRDWQEGYFKQGKFIAEPRFYIVFKHKNSINQNKFWYKALAKFLTFSYSSLEIDQEYQLFEQKIQSSKQMLANIGIKVQQLKGDQLRDFANQWLKFNQEEILEDHNKYLKFANYQKTYRVINAPESGDLDFWILDYLRLLDTESFISIHLSPRNSHQDRRKLETKAEIIKNLSRSSKPSTQSIIIENQKISTDLLQKPYSFDLSIFITVEANSIEELQRIDNFIRKPLRQTKLAGLERQQIKNWLYSLPFAYNQLSDKEKIFANLDFARSCFPFVDYDLGTREGNLLGAALYDSKPVFCNEYDRTYFNNRAINFIGDSGSGKTVAAKLAIKRRLNDPSKKFYIVDNTEDGWKFFIDSFNGTIIEVDKYISSVSGESLFTPFKLDAVLFSEEFNTHIEYLINLLATIKDEKLIITASDKLFLTQSFINLYQQSKTPSLSDLYCLWQGFDNDMSKKWLELIAPYCRVGNGIYSSLMDGYKSPLATDSRLILFSFSKLIRDSSFVPVSLYLLANFINQKISYEKETKITLVIDEAWKIFTAANGAKARELLSHFARAGRGLDLGLWTISQKPSDIPREIHSSASASLCFQLKESADRIEMANSANLNQNEKSLLESPLLFEAGNALFKSTRSSGLINIALDPYEEILCSSNRELVNQRNQIYLDKLSKLKDRSLAALTTIQELACLR